MYGTNFFNPYMYGAGRLMNGANAINSIGRAGVSKGLFSNLFKNFSLSGFLSGTSKTLNVINQAIPIYYQVKPMISNAKTMFKVMNAVKSDNTTNTKSNNINKTNAYKNTTIKKEYATNNEQPTFFV